EMALPDRAFGSLAHRGEGGNQNVVERRAVGNLLLERRRARAQRLVGELFDLGLERVDGIDPRLVLADAAVVCGTKELAGKSADHAEILSASLARRVTSPDRHNDLPRARVPSPHAFRLVPLMHHAIRRFLRLNRRTIPSPARSWDT